MCLDILTNKQKKARGMVNMVNIAKFLFLVTACMSLDVLVWFFSFSQTESYQHLSDKRYTGYISDLWKLVIGNHTVAEFLQV